MKKWLIPGGVAVVLAGLLALRLYNDKTMDADDAPVASPMRTTAVDGIPAVKLRAEELRAAGIRVTHLDADTHVREVSAVALVMPVTDLSRLRAEAATAQAQVQAAQAKALTSEAQVKRLRVLRQQEQEVSLTELQAAEATLAADRAAVQAATALASANRQTATLQWGSVLGRAVFDGTPTFQALADGREVLLQITLPSGTRIAQPPSTLDIATDGKSIRARYLGTAMQSDPRLQGTSYFYVAPTGALRTGTTIDVVLPTGESTSGWHVSAQAAVRWQGKPWVYTQHDATTFLRRELPEYGAERDGWSVPTGFAHGEPIVITGGQLLLSEELRTQQKGDAE